MEEAGSRPETVADRLGLSRAEVYNALAYYHENPGEMREAEELRRRRVEGSRDEAITAEDLE